MQTYKLTHKQIRYIKIKRVMDCIISLILLIPGIPIMLIASICIMLESRGSALYIQRRPGYKKNIFSIYKLRSMRNEVRDKEGKALTDKERLTKSGKFVRKTSIDELPQLFNVIKGDMALIGPRPQLINDLPTFTEEQMIRFEVLPGITSLAALHGRNNQPLDEKYGWDMYYVKHISFKLDLYIFIKTIFQIFSQRDIDDEINDVIPAAEIISDNGRNK